MTHRMSGRFFTMKTLIRAAFAALSLASIGVAHAQSASYHPPPHNYHQGNWMAASRG